MQVACGCFCSNTCTAQGWPHPLPNHVIDFSSKQVLRALCMAAAWTTHRPVHSNTFKGCVTDCTHAAIRQSGQAQPARHVQANSLACHQVAAYAGIRERETSTRECNRQMGETTPSPAMHVMQVIHDTSTPRPHQKRASGQRCGCECQWRERRVPPGAT